MAKADEDEDESGFEKSSWLKSNIVHSSLNSLKIDDEVLE
jgi:hypothetical protein